MPKKILIIEDDFRIQASTKRLLEVHIQKLNENIEIVQAFTADEGLEKLKENLDIDLLVLDGCLADRNTPDGLQIIPDIRKIYLTPRKILANSSSEDLRRMMLEAGATDECEKRYTAANIVHLLLLQEAA